MTSTDRNNTLSVLAIWEKCEEDKPSFEYLHESVESLQSYSPEVKQPGGPSLWSSRMSMTTPQGRQRRRDRDPAGPEGARLPAGHHPAGRAAHAREYAHRPCEPAPRRQQGVRGAVVRILGAEVDEGLSAAYDIYIDVDLKEARDKSVDDGCWLGESHCL